MGVILFITNPMKTKIKMPGDFILQTGYFTIPIHINDLIFGRICLLNKVPKRE
jgi:hypothetical protein